MPPSAAIRSYVLRIDMYTMRSLATNQRCARVHAMHAMHATPCCTFGCGWLHTIVIMHAIGNTHGLLKLRIRATHGRRRLCAQDEPLYPLVAEQLPGGNGCDCNSDSVTLINRLQVLHTSTLAAVSS